MLFLAALGTSEISTESFAKHFFSLLGTSFEERESSHYEEGGYFKGVYNNITFYVYTSYADDKADMPIPMPLSITVDGKDEAAVDSAIDFIIRSKLIPEGYKFLREVESVLDHKKHWVDFS